MNWLTIHAPSVSLAELVVRGTVIFLVLLALLRVVGQRESGGLGITDVLLIVLVAEAAAAGLHGEATAVADGLILSVTILSWSVVVDAVAYRFPRAARVLKARPKVLIQDGQLNRKVMLREFMTRRRGRLPNAAPWHHGHRRCPEGLHRARRNDQRPTARPPGNRTRRTSRGDVSSTRRRRSHSRTARDQAHTGARIVAWQGWGREGSSIRDAVRTGSVAPGTV